MKVLFIGTGVMGKPMALHLAKNGVDVTVYNRTYEKALELKPNVKVEKDLLEAIKDKDLIFSIVGYPKDVKEVYETIIPLVKKGTILVDMTTSSPTLAKELFNLATKHEVHLLDAPVTGGDLGAINATLSIMVGGNEEIFEKVLPYFNMMGKTITYMGLPGSGQHMKLANQIVIAGNLMGVAEGITYAKDKQLDLNKFLDVIIGGSANSWQASVNGKKMIVNDFKPGFYIKHFLKDLRLALEEFNLTKLPILETTEKILTSLQELENEGTQAVIKYYLK